MIQLGDFEYDTRRQLGRGRFGTVYGGNFTANSSKEVAVKFVENSRYMSVSYVLKREISLLQALRHPNIVKLYAYFISENRTGIHLVMELCNGGDLSTYLSIKRTIPVRSIRMILNQVASALNEMNKLKIIHRDLKPANIMLCHCKRCGKLSTDLPIEEITFKIGDLGLARVLKRNEMAATICGSPMYMAPELHLKKPYDGKADVWSLGTIIFECLTGKAPFIAGSLFEMAELFRSHPGLKPSIPLGTDYQLGQLLTEMLAYYPVDRPDFDQLLGHPFFLKMQNQHNRKLETLGPCLQHIVVNAKPPTNLDILPLLSRRSKDDLWCIRLYREPYPIPAVACERGCKKALPDQITAQNRSNSVGRAKSKRFKEQHNTGNKQTQNEVPVVQKSPTMKTPKCQSRENRQNPCNFNGVQIKNGKKFIQKRGV